MNRLFVPCLGIVCTVAAWPLPAEEAALCLVDEGRPRATIVIAKDATDLQQLPAGELQEYVRKMAGAVLPIRDDGQTPEGNLVLVGESRLTRAMGVDLSSLTGDSFTIKATDGRLVLAGHDARLLPDDPYHRAKRGTANAVSAFLQDVCGVRWFIPGELGEVVPQRKTLTVQPLDRRETLYRSSSGGSFSRSPWAHRNFFGEQVFTSPTGCHLWHVMIPAEKYFDEHPEWFAQIDGKRVEGDRRHSYLCTSNRQMWDEALRNLKELYASGYERVVLCQADGYRRCQCEACEAMDDYRIGGWYLPSVPADRVWVFHDFLARGIQKAYPDRKLVVLAYGPTGEVPRRLEGLPDNVIVEWCHPTRGAVGRWTQFHDQFSAFVYWFVSESRNYVPMPFRGVDSEFKRLASAGVRSFYFCGGNRCWGIHAPSYYLIGQLLRDPKRDAGEVLDEFCRGLFEQSAAPMRSYFEAFHEKTGHRWELMLPETLGQPYDYVAHEKPRELYLAGFPDEVLARCERHLTRAEALAPNDVVSRRIRLFRDGFEYSKLTTEGFARLKEFQQNRSEKSLTALHKAVDRRNRFVEDLFERQKHVRTALPEALSGSLEHLLYGTHGHLAMPFQRLPKAAGRMNGS